MTNFPSAHHPETGLHKQPVPITHTTDQPPVQNTVSCSICQAMYRPDSSHAYLLNTPHMALDSAFMSMCHFCFRCRRPSCPNCWDHIHGICAQCAVETQIPFRIQEAPLDGVLISPLRQAQIKRKQHTPNKLVCIQAGRFHTLAPIETVETIQLQSLTHPARTETARQRALLAEITTRPPRTGKIARATQTSIHTASEKVAIDQIATRPILPRHKKALPQKSIWQRLEHILTVLLAILLSGIILLIIASSISPDANSFITRVLHVDIRAEIAYLLQLIKQLF